MDAQENSLLVIPWSESAEGPLADARGDIKGARGDIKGARGDIPFLSFRATYSCRFERSEKSPHLVMPLYPVMPSVARHLLLGHGKRLELRTTKNR